MEGCFKLLLLALLAHTGSGQCPCNGTETELMAEKNILNNRSAQCTGHDTDIECTWKITSDPGTILAVSLSGSLDNQNTIDNTGRAENSDEEVFSFVTSTQSRDLTPTNGTAKNEIRVTLKGEADKDAALEFSFIAVDENISEPNCSSTSIPVTEGFDVVIASPNFPKHYTNDLNCSWTFTPAVTGGCLNLSVIFMSTEDQCGDAADPLTIKYGQLSSQGCGDTLQGDEFSSKNNVQVSFESDGSITAPGFLISVSATAPDPCIDVTCSNGGTCDSNTGKCNCTGGYTGEFCDDAPDPCIDVTCSNGGTCDSNTGKCNCTGGYTGEFCDDAPDPCIDVTCSNGGTCDSNTGKCNCTGGYTGEFCDDAPDPCIDVTCSNGGTCDSNTGKCNCTGGYTGEFCDDAPDPCIDVTCCNNGICDSNTGKCNCTSGYFGKFCRKEKCRPKCRGNRVCTACPVDNNGCTEEMNRCKVCRKGKGKGRRGRGTKKFYCKPQN